MILVLYSIIILLRQSAGSLEGVFYMKRKEKETEEYFRIHFSNFMWAILYYKISHMHG